MSVYILPLAPQPTTGVRQCLDCSALYAAAVAFPTVEVCTGCQSTNTKVVHLSPLTVETLEAFKQTLPHNKKTWRWCIPCGKKYIAPVWIPSLSPAESRAVKECPVCHEFENTFACENPEPIQDTLFTVPPPPSPNLWRVERRWAKNRRKTGYATRPPEDWHPEPPNDWRPYNKYNINSLKSARNQAVRLRRVYPWEEWRVTVVGWEPVPLIVPFPERKS